MTDAKKTKKLVVSKKELAEAPPKPKKATKETLHIQIPNSEIQDTPSDKVGVAKAGRRSAKAIKEAEEEQIKQERKAQGEKPKTEEEKTKHVQKPPRSRLERRSKNYRKAVELIDKTKVYDPKEATELIVKTSPVKFDATVELHVRLDVDPKNADQNIRDTVILPAGTGKDVRIAVLTETDAGAAKKAGAAICGTDEILDMLEKNQIDFDLLIATPETMPKLGKYARLLGPKGLMPNPKSGTVTKDVVKAVEQAVSGRVEYRVDPTGIIHMPIGKVSFGGSKLLDNFEAALDSLRHNKPASVKGVFIISAYITTAMGPSIRLSL